MACCFRLLCFTLFLVSGVQYIDSGIVSTRIRVGRNMDNMPLGPAISSVIAAEKALN